MFPPKFSIGLILANRVPTNNPPTIPKITTPMDTNKPAHRTWTVFPSGYAPLMYMNKFSGNKPMDNKEETVVIATLSAKSPLNMLVHQLLYEPPGEDVVIINGIPISGLSAKIVLATANPSKGKNTNCAKQPITKPLLLKDSRNAFTLTVLAKPNTNPYNNTFPVMASHDPNPMMPSPRVAFYHPRPPHARVDVQNHAIFPRVNSPTEKRAETGD